MFFGKTTHKLDTKGRLNLPSRFKSKIDTKIYLNISITMDYLEIVTEDSHNRRQEFLNTFNYLDPDANQLKIFMNAFTYEIELDKAGRVNIPQEVMETVGITTNVVVTGNGDKIAIWDEQKFIENSKLMANDIKDIAKRLSEKVYKNGK